MLLREVVIFRRQKHLEPLHLTVHLNPAKNTGMLCTAGAQVRSDDADDLSKGLEIDVPWAPARFS